MGKERLLARVDFTKGGSLWTKDSGMPVGQPVRVGCSMLLARLTKRAAVSLNLAIGAGVVGAGEVRCSDRAGCSVICEHENAKR